MSFKRNPLFSTVLLVILSLAVGCTEFLRGPKAKEEVLEIDIPEAQCLSEVPQRLYDFLDDKLSAAKVDESFACIKQGMKRFVRFHRGASSEFYSQQEVQHFFNRYLFDKNKLSDGFMDELMKVKVAVVGGSRHGFTPGEIEQFSGYISVVNTQLNTLLGSMKLLLFNLSRSDVSLQQIKTAQTKLNRVLLNLVYESKLPMVSYDFSDFESLVLRFNEFLGSDRLHNTLKWIPMMKAAKNLFLGESLRANSKAEWRTVVQWITDAFGLGLRVYYQAGEKGLRDPRWWDVMLSFGDEAFELLDRAPEYLETGVFQAKSIDRFIEELYALELFKLPINVGVFKTTYRKILTHWLDQQKDESNEVRGLESRHLRVLKGEFMVWRQGQVLINSAFKEKSEYSSAEFLAFAIQHPEVEKVGRSLPGAIFNQDELKLAYQEWLKTFDLPRVPVYTDNLNMAVDYSAGFLNHRFMGLTISNSIRMIVRLWMRGYGIPEQKDEFRWAMTETRLIDMEKDFQEFGRAVGFLDPRVKDAAPRTFMEGNFLTYSGNGNDRLDGQEAYELFHFLISGGVLIRNHFIDSAKKAACQVETKDYFGNPKYQLTCIQKLLVEQMDQLFPGLPSSRSFLKKSIENKTYDDFFAALIALAREKTFEADLTEDSELRTMSVLLQYVESIFVQFDLNKSQGISKAEVFSAEPRFRPFFKKMRPGIPDWAVPEIFLYLLQTGKIPEFRAGSWDSFWQSFKHWTGYASDRFWKNNEANRLQVLRLLGVLKNNVPQLQ